MSISYKVIDKDRAREKLAQTITDILCKALDIDNGKIAAQIEPLEWTKIKFMASEKQNTMLLSIESHYSKANIRINAYNFKHMNKNIDPEKAVKEIMHGINDLFVVKPSYEVKYYPPAP
ncbi:MAG: hypothetical protein ACP5HW_00805 [Candidatus Micrarchaeia archaeon]